MPRKLSEDLTRKRHIDPQLEQAGWYLRYHSKVKIEIPVDGYDAEPWNGVSDYCLYRENGEVLAVVEAKRTTTDVRLAEAQLTYYVTEIEKHQSFRPFGFLANGLEIHFVDVGIAHKREVFGFFTHEDLENLLYIRQNAKPLSPIEINNEIVDHSYQPETIRRVGDTFLASACTDGKPTYLYTYEQVIENKYLVDYELYAARTKFQRQGIHGVDVTEEERISKEIAK